MIGGLLDDALHELRELFPRSAIPELIDRIAGFKHEVFASTTYFAEQIGRSRRQVFRYWRRLKEEGILVRTPGQRAYDAMPRGSTPKGQPKLHCQGYRLTSFIGPFAGWIMQHQSRRKERYERKEASKERKRQARADKRARESLEHEAWAAERYPHLAAKAAKATNRPAAPPAHSAQVESAPSEYQSARSVRAPERAPPD